MRVAFSVLTCVIAFCAGAVIQAVHRIAPYALLVGIGASFLVFCLVISLACATNTALAHECWNCGAEVPCDDTECWNCEVPQ